MLFVAIDLDPVLLARVNFATYAQQADRHYSV
jgi:hypothetical protein